MKDSITMFGLCATYPFVSCDCEVNQGETMMAELDFLSFVATKLDLKLHQPQNSDWEIEKYSFNVYNV